MTNSLDQGATDESIGIGDMRLKYKFDPNVEGTTATTSPANYDAGEENPTGLWENNCHATKKSCAGYDYYGGYNECA